MARVAEEGESPLLIHGSEKVSYGKFHIQKIKMDYSKFTEVVIEEP